MGVASPRIFDAARTRGCTTVAHVTKAVRAGGGCGLCHPEIEEILCDVHGAPFDAALSLENQLVCRQETAARIEGTLVGLLAPRLTQLDVRIAALDVEGLRVCIRLAGAVTGETARLLIDALRKHVCADLDVQIASARDTEAEPSSLG